MAATILHISLLVHFLLTNFPPTIAWNGTTPVQEECYFHSQALPIPHDFTNLPGTSFGSPNLAVGKAQQYIEHEGGLSIEALMNPEFFPYNEDFEMPEILLDVSYQHGQDIGGAHTIPNIQVAQIPDAENVNPETSNNAGNFLVWNASSPLNQSENELPKMDFLKSEPEITVGDEQQHMNSYDLYGTQTVRTPRSNEMSSERPNMVTDTNQLVNALHQRGHIDSAHAIYRPVIRRAETLNPEHFNPPNVRGSFLLSGSISLVTQFENRLPEKEFRKSEAVITAGRIIDEQQHTSPSDAYSGQMVTVFRCKRESAQAFPKASYQCSIVSCNQSMESFQEFKMHLKSHNREDENRCYWLNCGRNFTTQQALELHYSDHLLVDHSEINIHKCMECGQFFWAKHLLLIHRNKMHRRGKKPSDFNGF